MNRIKTLLYLNCEEENLYPKQQICLFYILFYFVLLDFVLFTSNFLYLNLFDHLVRS